MDAQAPATDVLPFRDDVRALLDRVEAHDGPLVTLYLDAHSENDPNAPAQRADAALRDLDLERSQRERLENRVQTTLRDAREGWLAIFADPSSDDEALYEYRLLRVEPPLPGGRRDAFAQHGEALVSPLRLLLEAEPPVVVTYVDERRARIFVVDLGDVQETASSVMALNDEEWRDYRQKPTSDDPTSATGRAGSGKDEFDDRKEAWTARFTKALGERLAEEASRREGARLVLLGEPGRTEQVHDALPQHMKENALLVGGAAVADPDQPATIWARPLAERVREILVEREEEALARFDEVGTSTLAETLDNLQKGLLERVAVPVDRDVEVLRCLENGWLAHREEDLRDVCGEGPIERVFLKRHLAKAVRQGAAELLLLRGEGAAERVQANFGGLAGVPRH